MTRAELLQVAKPILFNTDMVKAILDDRKTVTRRVMKPQPWKIGEGEYECRHEKGFFDMRGNDWACRQCGCGVIPMKGGSYFHAPYQPGDILYVRETWAPLYPDGKSNEICGYMYKAEKLEDYDARYPNGKNYQWGGRWKPSIHMPKEAARIFLRVTDVRVERLQEISEYQIVAEGTQYDKEDYAQWKRGDVITFNAETYLRGCYRDLWNSTIKKSDLDRYGWDANPWVWVIEFERVEVG